LTHAKDINILTYKTIYKKRIIILKKIIKTKPAAYNSR